MTIILQIKNNQIQNYYRIFSDLMKVNLAENSTEILKKVFLLKRGKTLFLFYKNIRR